MTDCKGGCADNFGNNGYRRYLDGLDAENRLFSVPKELIASVIERETEGERFFNLTDQLFKDNLREAGRLLNVHPPFFLQHFVPKDGPMRGMITKFRVEPGWVTIAKNWARDTPNENYWRLMLPVSFGFGQKWMNAYLEQFPKEQWMTQFWLFIGTPRLQITTIAKDMSVLTKQSGGDVRLALTRYNAGATAKRVSSYGKEVFDDYLKRIGEL